MYDVFAHPPKLGEEPAPQLKSTSEAAIEHLLQRHDELDAIAAA